MTRYMYMESTPRLQGKARKFGAGYRRIAIVALEENFQGVPKMISKRARGVSRVVREATTHIGTSDRSAGYRLREEFKAWVSRQNAVALKAAARAALVKLQEQEKANDQGAI